MAEEILTVFDEDHKKIGTATRTKIHKTGEWHETFHCWLVSRPNGKLVIHFQMRSPHKKDYPAMLDITAAGHLLENETVEDGVRELEEEIGLSLSFDELHPLGIIKETLHHEKLIDAEICHVFAFEVQADCQFRLQKSEVTGMYQLELDSFKALLQDESAQIIAKGFEEDAEGARYNVDKTVSKLDFVPHEAAYFAEVIKRIEEAYPQLMKLKG
ncbi:NUDIX hydrolase [Jeotgalibacillus proteolyticus]|uniref:NUDIX hydrolase n=1 Tax=Jeotgalibacillus proteolyticus TaxID=2082395 RepID=UPI00142FE0D4|nr:NUDIX domain-containing protein [Jeotgalibacillus proteolyticus]